MAITTADEARRSNQQHTKPCGDCPWRRKSTPGWLGGATAESWIAEAHGDAPSPCHTVFGDPQPQCVGLATYRANVCKLPRDRSALRVPADWTRVFSAPAEFIAHHEGID